jgi:hypothetical protein
MLVGKILFDNKKAGVCYALTRDNAELPVIDITNPVFTVNISHAELSKITFEFVAAQKKQAKIPVFIQKFVFSIMMRNSVFGRAIMGIESGFLSGMHTYMMKLGPENLGKGFDNKIDIAIAGSLPSLAMRIRLQDTAVLMTDALTPLLEANPGADLTFINIAGGPAADSINTLILLKKQSPKILDNRKIVIHVLDVNEAGPFFGKNGLNALQEINCPLYGVNAEFKYDCYDWTKSWELKNLLAIDGTENNITAISSEGGLFEYGNDDIVASNLSALASLTKGRVIFAGSVTRDEGPVKELKKTSRVPTVQRSADEFAKLASASGWEIKKNNIGTFSRNVLMTKKG